MSEPEYADRPNKTQIKREIKVLNKLGKELIALADGSLAKVPLSDVMRDAIRDGQRFRKGALQRQLRRIAKLMQHEDVEAIQRELQRQRLPDREQTRAFHELEKQRDLLIAGEEGALEQLISSFPDVDRQYVRQLVRNAQLEKKREKPPKSARSLFKYLSQLQSLADTGVES